MCSVRKIVVLFLYSSNILSYKKKTFIQKFRPKKTDTLFNTFFIRLSIDSLQLEKKNVFDEILVAAQLFR